MESISEPHDLPLTYLGINDKYTIDTLIDEGSFGQVYKAVLTRNPTQEFAVKIQESSATISCLISQCRIYRQIQQIAPTLQEGRSFVPKMYYCAKQDEYNVLVMELMGASLRKLLLQEGNKVKSDTVKRVQIKTVLLLAEQMISALEYIHRRGIIHRDLKPANFCVGQGDKFNHIFLVDFGLATPYIVNGRHISQGKTQGMIGNRTYSSIASHKLQQQSRKDDLESLGYILIDWAQGSLPWKRLNSLRGPKLKSSSIGRLKMQTSLHELCKGLHESFLCYLQEVRRLRFQETPNYEFYRNLFRLALLDLGLNKETQSLFD